MRCRSVFGGLWGDNEACNSAHRTRLWGCQKLPSSQSCNISQSCNATRKLVFCRLHYKFTKTQNLHEDPRELGAGQNHADVGCSNGAHINCTCPKKPTTPVQYYAFIQMSKRNDSLHQIGRPDLPEHNIHVHVKKRNQPQEDERRGLVEYNQTIKHDNSMPSDQIILSCDQIKNK